jgi:hypothetical protein
MNAPNITNWATALLVGRRIEVALLAGRVEVGTICVAENTPPNCISYRLDDGSARVANLQYVNAMADYTPETQALKARMLAVWDTLPVEVRAAFRPLKTAVLDAINDGCLDEVHLLVSQAEVPAEYAAAKDGLLALLTAPPAA